ncbi:MAG: hypothetical protein IJX87_05745, partial [Clostridia bacterium]|nr:hypothetical protein [Clostridia bacterium]
TAIARPNDAACESSATFVAYCLLLFGAFRAIFRLQVGLLRFGFSVLKRNRLSGFFTSARRSLKAKAFTVC